MHTRSAILTSLLAASSPAALAAQQAPPPPGEDGPSGALDSQRGEYRVRIEQTRTDPGAQAPLVQKEQERWRLLLTPELGLGLVEGPVRPGLSADLSAGLQLGSRLFLGVRGGAIIHVETDTLLPRSGGTISTNNEQHVGASLGVRSEVSFPLSTDWIRPWVGASVNRYWFELQSNSVRQDLSEGIAQEASSFAYVGAHWGAGLHAGIDLAGVRLSASYHVVDNPDVAATVRTEGVQGPGGAQGRIETSTRTVEAQMNYAAFQIGYAWEPFAPL